MKNNNIHNPIDSLGKTAKINTKQQKIEVLTLLATFLVLLSAVYLSYVFYPEIEKLQLQYLNTSWGTTFIIVTTILFVIKISFLLFNFVLYLTYKQTKVVSDNELPTCMVIVPAYNEGNLVYHTLLSIAQSDYPNHKLEILAIDDGSKDDTWDWMKKAKAVLGNRVILHQQPKNMGKRHALYYGFKNAISEVVVTIDSDSIIEKDTLKNLVSPFVINKKCGAVAGNVKVLNTAKAIIPKMLDVSFAFSFEFIRSAQSTLGSVFCTPGALAAYKTTVVKTVLEDWVNQTFMGKPSDIGEDRAMTNMILKEGFEVRFQKNAIVHTNIPERYKNLYKMFIRWERSNIRETILMSKFAFKDFREGSKSGTRIILLDQWIKIIFSFPLLFAMLAFLITHPFISIISTLVGILIFSSIQMFFFAKKHSVYGSLWAYPYSIFYAFALFWITPYSIATAGRSGWLTR